VKVSALVTDLIDRSRISVALPGATFMLTPDADVVIVDLGRGIDQVVTVRNSHPDARIVAYGPHVDDESMAAARSAGADVVVPRSRFFRDPAQIVGMPA